MKFYWWVNHLTGAPLERGHRDAYGTKRRLINSFSRDLGYVQRHQVASARWTAHNPHGERIGDTYRKLDEARQALIDNNFMGRAGTVSTEMKFYWINNVDLTPVTRGNIANARVGTEYRLVNDDGESLGYVVRRARDGRWAAFDPWLEGVGDKFSELTAARQALVKHNYQGRAD